MLIYARLFIFCFPTQSGSTSAVQTRCLNELIDQYRIKLENITMYGLDHYDNVSDSSIMYILEHAPNIKRSSLLFYLGIFFALVYSFGSGAVQVIIKKLCMQKVTRDFSLFFLIIAKKT